MPKIKILFLSKDRVIRHLKRELKGDGFIYKNGYYSIERGAINTLQKLGKNIKPSEDLPELFYVESNPVPLMGTTLLTPLQFLDKIVAINYLEKTAKVSRGLFGVLQDVGSSMLDNAPKVLLLSIAFIIVWAVVFHGV